MKKSHITENGVYRPDYSGHYFKQLFWGAIYPRAVSPGEVKKLHEEATTTHAKITALHLKGRQAKIETRKLISEINCLIDEDVKAGCSTTP